MLDIDLNLTPQRMNGALERLWSISARKIESIDRDYDESQGSPVFTIQGRYQPRGWTEWTRGFIHGSALLQFEATGKDSFLELGRVHTLRRMPPHLTHVGVHDHGFNNLSTFGTLLRLMRDGRIAENEWERRYYELALKVSGAVQAARWTAIEGGGFIHSFNGPHSLFVDTLRSCRSLVVAHLLGHHLMVESDRVVDLLERALVHARSTAQFSVYYGEGRDIYDVRGRTAHESIFNVTDGNYRCAGSQQGYSGNTTWTRGLAWAMCGFAEQLQALEVLSDADLQVASGREAVRAMMLRAARATCDFYIANTPTCGVPYWDTGAPGLARLGDYLNRPADPRNEHEPVDSSAAAIAAQGLLRLGSVLGPRSDEGRRYFQAGLTVVQTLIGDNYLSVDPAHEGLLLHSIYHRPGGWDHAPEEGRVPSGESSAWGDYHLREAALCVQRLAEGGTMPTFYGGVA